MNTTDRIDRPAPLPPKSPRGRRPAGQRGAALLTAMIIVTLVTTLAAAMVWQQWRAVQVESAERARGQSIWILAGALDFGTLILREDQKTNVPTRLTEPWATPLAESRLSTFLSADSTATDSDDGPEAFLSGSIADAQAKYNLTNLTIGEADAKKKELQTLSQLCSLVGVDSSVATLIATRLNAAAAGGSTEAPLLPKKVDQLGWFGIDTATIRMLAPYVVILPSAASINPNTASKEVLAAAFGIDSGSAERLVTLRQRNPYKDDAAFQQRGDVDLSKATSAVSVAPSIYFEVSGQLRLADHVVTQRTLVQRLPTPPYRHVVWRDYVASVEQPGT